MPEAKGVLEGLTDFSFRLYATPSDVEISVRAALAHGTYRRGCLGRAGVPGPGAGIARAARRIGRVFFLDTLLSRRPRSTCGCVSHGRRDSS